MGIRHIDLAALRAGPEGRIAFLEEFVGFTEDDRAALRESALALGPRLPAMVDRLYDHLLSFDDTREVFVDEGGTINPKYIAIRKEHLTEWVMRAITETDRAEVARYATLVGKKHTHAAGDPDRAVPARYVVGHMANVQVVFWSALFEAMPNEPERVQRMGLAWTKMMMIQLELMLWAAVPGWDGK
jgi:hypothetical protein